MVASTTPTSGEGATVLPGRMVECRGLWPAGTAAAGPFTEGKNITGAPTIEAARAACERHAEQRTDIP